ncbi:hypothetical protein MPSEU_000595000 [Mayamaea pseudoterrestris]|nr:hypothetical protein MPSEU_000595000 [Mayamaea pseudoterrestris]
MEDSEEAAPRFGSILSKWKEKGRDQQNDLQKLGGRYKPANTTSSKPSPEKSLKVSASPDKQVDGSFHKLSEECAEGDGARTSSTSDAIDSLPTEGEQSRGRVGATDHGRRSSFTFWNGKSKEDVKASSDDVHDPSLQDSNSKFERESNTSGDNLTTIGGSNSIDSALSPKPSDVRRKFNGTTAFGGAAVPTMFVSKGLGFKPAATSPKTTLRSNIAPHTAPTVSKPKVQMASLMQPLERSNANREPSIVEEASSSEREEGMSPSKTPTYGKYKTFDEAAPLTVSPKSAKKVFEERGKQALSPKHSKTQITGDKQVTTNASPKVLPKAPPNSSPPASPEQATNDQATLPVAPLTPPTAKLVVPEQQPATSMPISPTKRTKADNMKSFMATTKSPLATRKESVRMTTRMSFRKALDDAPDYKPPVHERVEGDGTIIRDALLKNFVFSSLPERELEEMCNAFEECSFKAKETIVASNNPGEHFYIVKKGTVDVIMDGKPATQAHGGDSFGELSLVYAFASQLQSQQTTSGSTAIAATDVTLFRVDQKTVRLTLKSQQTKSEDDRLNLLQGVRFLKELCEADLKKLASCMTPVPFGKDQLIVERGAASSNSFYIIQEGSVICKDVTAGQTDYTDQVLGPGEWFGESSLISNESLHMNVIAQARGMLYSIDRKQFDSVLGKFKDLVLKAQDAQRLAGMKCLQNAKLNGRQLASLASVFVEKKYMHMQLILAQGLKTKIAIFFVRKGEVEISSRGKVEVVKAGGYFGDTAFKDDGTFDASIYWKPPFSAKALSPVVCGILTLQDARNVFDTALLAEPSAMSESFNLNFARVDTDADLEDLIKNCILGEGSFGQVWLVSEPLPDIKEARPFALKIQSKCDLAQEGQIKAVMEEKKILAQIQHPFTCKLVKAFQDSMFVYLLMEYIQGGELFSLLHSDEHHDRGFPEEQAKFYAFCLADVFAYIHRSKIVFRDLKPENVMIDHLGYPILIDFG